MHGIKCVINARLVEYIGILDNGCKHLRNTSLKAFTTVYLKEQLKYFSFLSAYFSSKCFMKLKYILHKILEHKKFNKPKNP